MVRVSTNRGTSTARVGSSRSKKRAKPSMRSGRGTISRGSTGSYSKARRAKPSMRSGRGTISRVAKRKSRATGMRAARASGKVKRSGRGYIAASGGSAKKKATARPSMRSGRGTIRRSSSGTYKKSTTRKRASTRSGRGYVRR